MAAKRSAADADIPAQRTTRQSSAKRNKLSSPPTLVEQSSNASTRASERVQSEDTAPTSVTSSATETGSGSDSDGEVHGGSSSVGDEADAEYEEESEPERIISIPRPRAPIEGRPKIDPNVVMAYAKELEAKLHAFLPKLRQANSKLSEQSATLNMEHVNDNERHIEMNLDLGVLEQQSSNTNSGEIKLPGKHTSTEAQSCLPRGASVASLLNGRNNHAKPSIEVMASGGVPVQLPQRPGPMPS